MDNLKSLFVRSELRAATHHVIGRQWVESTEIDEMVYVMDNCSYSTFKALLEIDSDYGGKVKLKLMSVTQNDEPVELDSLQSSEIIALAKNAFFDTVGDESEVAA